MTPFNSLKTIRTASIALFGMLAAVTALSLAVPAASAAAPTLEATIESHPGTFHRGEEAEWENYNADEFVVNLTNTGDAVLPEFNVTEHVPPPFTAQSFIVVPDRGTCVGEGANTLHARSSEVSCELLELNPGETRALRFGFNVPLNAPDTASTEVDITAQGIPAIHLEGTAPVVDRRKFEVEMFESHIFDQNEANDTVAGAHPYQSVTAFAPPLADTGSQVELMKNAVTTLPNGFFGNPASAPRCAITKIPSSPEFFPGLNCPVGSRVGTVAITKSNKAFGGYPLYNVQPAKGHPAEFAFNAGFNTYAVLEATALPRSEGNGLAIVVTDTPRLAAGAGLSINEVTAYFFGVPYEHNVDFLGNHYGTEAPFLSNPVDCSAEDARWRLQLDSWTNPGRLIENDVTSDPDSSDPNWKEAEYPSPQVTGCDDDELAEEFEEATATAKLVQQNPGVQADQPTGLAVDFSFPQANDPTDPNAGFDPSKRQTPEVKDITTKLPAGLGISPSSADGLVGCSDSADDPAGDQVHYDNMALVTCPAASRIGTASITSPLLALHDPVTDANVGAQPVEGGVYLLKAHPGDFANGQDGKFRLLINLVSTRYGLNFKLPGVAVADRQTGQLTATFADNPQLPSSHVKVELKSGPRAPLATPVSCGPYTTDATLVPWGSPEIPSVTESSSFNVDSGPNGSACVSTPSQRPFTPALSAGTVSNKAGDSSPFVLKVTRNDGDQELSTIDVTTPPGFSAKLAGVATCSDEAIAAAAAKSGTAERANPSCPAGSQVGTVTVGAGPGSTPFYTTGKAYLAGPYKGAPLSLVFVTPAVAGPFDLGDVVTRAAVTLNSATTQVTVKTDPLPQMLDGVPLRLRSISTHLDRANFTVNPTDCEAMSVNTTIGGSNGASASPTQAFRVGGCKDLGFKPTLKLALKGSVKRRGHPSLKATLNARPGDANIASAQVKLPKSAFLDNAHIGEVCTRVQFAAHACPAGSIYGKATATTPLLGYTLAGPVYLRSSSHQLPDLVVAFQGPASQPIEIELAGKTDSVKGALRNTFEAVPDVPVSTFQLELFGGKKGLVVMSAGFCANPKATVNFTGQNGKESKSTPKVAAKCPKAKKKKHAGRKN